jgi:type IV secretion system protein VirD4
MTGRQLQKLLILNLPYAFLGLLATKLGAAWRFAEGIDFSTKFLHLREGLFVSFCSPLPSFQAVDLLFGLVFGCALRLIVYEKSRNAKKYRRNAEYGSARWGKPSDIAPFVDPDPWNNVILTQTERLTMNSRTKDPKTARNKNVLVIGGSGSGKTRFFIKPNIMQCTKTKGYSLVVTDPKGTLVVECGKMLVAAGYDVRVFNTINFKKSMHYNPFAYIHSEKDILKLVTTLIANTKGDGKSGDDFWQKAETLLYMALIGYIHYELPPSRQNFTTLIDMLNSMDVREDDEDYRNPVDLTFEKLAQKQPDHFAVRQYAKYRMAAGKTAKSILVSCGARLAVFDIAELREITSYDELGLDTLGERRTALFLIMSDTDASFNFLISLAYSQMFNLLCEKADDEHGGRLPVHVRCLIDEFANIGQIPNFEKLIATIRSREISACIVLQAKSQLKSIYKDNADTIEGNCDTLLFLGGKEKTTLKEMEELLGKETIDTFNTGENRGREVSHSLNYQKLGKSLMSVDELAVMDGGKCILQLRGVRPFLSDKYDITAHPNYKYLSDANPKNTFHIEKYLSRQLKLRLEEEFAAIEVDVSDSPEDEEAFLEEWTDENKLEAADYGGLF